MAYDLSGGAAIIEADAITLPTKMSLSIWSRRTGNGGAGFGRLIDHTSADSSLVGSMRLQNNGASAVNTYAFIYPWVTVPSWTFSRPPIDTWAHIAIAYDASATANVPTVWVNGSAVAVTTVSAPAGLPRVQMDNIAIGNRVFDKGRQFSGAVAEVAYWETLISTAVAQQLATGRRAIDVAPSGLRAYIPLASNLRNWITDVSATSSGADVTLGGAPVVIDVAPGISTLRINGGPINTAIGTLRSSAPTAGNVQLRGGAVTKRVKRLAAPAGGLVQLKGGAVSVVLRNPMPTTHGKWRGVGGAVRATAVVRKLQNTESPRAQSWLVRLRDSTAKAKISDARTKFVKVARIYANPLRTMTPSVGLMRLLGGQASAGRGLLSAPSSGKLRILGGVPGLIYKSKTVSQGALRLLGGAVDQRGQPVARTNGKVRVQSWMVRAGGSAIMARVSDARTKFVKVARIHVPRILRSNAPSAGLLNLSGGEAAHQRELYVGAPTAGSLSLFGGEPTFAIGNVRRATAQRGVFTLRGGAPSHTSSYGWAYLPDESASWSDMPVHQEQRHVLS